MPKAANSERQTLTDEVLGSLADLAKVSEEGKNLFCTEVREAVDLTWERHDLVTRCPTKKNIKALEKIASALYKSLRNLDKSERQFIEQVLRDRSFVFERISGKGALATATYQVAHLFSTLTGKPPPSYPHVPQRRAKRGKPSGSVDNWIFQDFVIDLVLAAQSAGGRLPVNVKDTKGPLIWAIQLLGPHLPVDLVEKQPSARTLRRLNELAGAVYKQACSLD